MACRLREVRAAIHGRAQLAGRMSLTLTACDGSAIVPNADCLSEEPTDLTFCECQMCQVYNQRTYATPSPPLENAMVTTVLQPAMESTHTLCLNHWTFFEISTAPPSDVQTWRDPELYVGSSIRAALGEDASTPRGIVLTLDTDYSQDQDRFTTVDAFLHLAPERPSTWYEVHHIDGFPAGVFKDTSARVDFAQQDSFTYTAGFAEGGATCSAVLPEKLYLGVRCGNPEGSKGSWNFQRLPCTFRVRYVLLPQLLVDGDAVGPVPIMMGSYHSYSVAVGGYDVLRYSIERVGDNLTSACNADGTECSSSGHGLIGTLYSSVNRCPTARGDASELTNGSRTAYVEWFCTQQGEEGRYFLAIRAATVLDPNGPVPGHVMYDGKRPVNPLVPRPGLQPNRLKAARGYYLLRVFHRAFEGGQIAPGEPRQVSQCVSQCVSHSVSQAVKESVSQRVSQSVSA